MINDNIAVFRGVADLPYNFPGKKTPEGAGTQSLPVPGQYSTVPVAAPNSQLSSIYPRACFPTAHAGLVSSQDYNIGWCLVGESDASRRALHQCV